MPSNHVFIGVSLDGYIADRKGGLGFLDTFPNPEGDDMGYSQFISSVDALVMGRNSFETVLGFDIEWPYSKPVYVLSSTLEEVPTELSDRVFIVRGPIRKALEEIHSKGHKKLYVDGGRTIQSFLKEDLIDDMVITTIPVLIGGGVPLFGTLEESLKFECVETHIMLGKVAQCQYKRLRD